MKILRVNFSGIGLSCYVYTDYELFKKNHVNRGDAKKDGTTGQSSGNGIWLDAEHEDINETIVHEISHYLDFVLTECLYITDMEQASELRARMAGYLYSKILKRLEREI